MKYFAIFMYLLLSAGQSMADHPQEGPEKLNALVQEALSQSKALQARQLISASKDSDISAARLRFLPDLKLETGRKATFDALAGSKTFNSYMQLNSTVNLYKGGSDQKEIALRHLERDESIAAERQQRVGIAAAVASYFYELQYASEGLNLIEKTIVASKINREQSDRRVRSGQVAPSESLKFAVLDNRLRANRAENQALETDVTQRLRFLLGRGDSQSLKIKGHLIRENWRPAIDDIIAKTIQNNPDLSLEGLKEKVLRVKTNIETSKYHPSVDAKGLWGRLPDDSKTDMGPISWSAELRLTLPIFESFRTNHNRESLINQRAAQEILITQTEQTLRNEVRELVNHLNSLDSLLEIHSGGISKISEHLSAVKSEYARGIKDSGSLADATEALLVAELKLIDLKRDWYYTKVKLQSISGDILTTKL